MVKRRQIREAVIQFLYLTDLEEGPDASQVQDAFWQIVQENSLRKLTQAKVKAVLHITQARESRLTRLAQRSTLALAQLKAAKGANELLTALQKFNAHELDLSSALDLMGVSSRATSDDCRLDARLEDVFSASRCLSSSRLTWEHTLEDFPAWKNKLEAVNATILQLGRVTDRLDTIGSSDQENLGPLGLGHLSNSEQEILAFRNQSEEIIRNVLAKKESLDAKLIHVVENFAPERVAPVDRAILRLGTYEILYCEDIPRAVSINEAIEIAKKFGGSDSSRFINGVLDAIKT